ncbi:MAG: carbohydrate ABC transporter permease [Alicyclobacillus shizuokensis]|nr:carbohydrate ABC transporter permease [Alicyclobacillus shizuokensis]
MVQGGVGLRAKRRGVLYLIAVVLFVVQVFPFLYVFSNSLRTPATAMRGFALIPNQFHFSNYERAWSMAGMGHYFINSVVITAISTFLTVVVTALAGYAFGRIRFWGRGILFGIVLSGMIIPSQVTVIPLYIFLQHLNLLNNYLALVFPYIAMQTPFSIFVFRNYFMTLPKELEDSAKMDGCGMMRTFWNVMMPLALPAIATVTIFSFMSDWSEFLYATVFMTDPNMMTLPTGLVHFQGQYTYDWPLLFAAIVMIIIPVLVVFMFLQKFFVKGLTAGAVKG